MVSSESALRPSPEDTVQIESLMELISNRADQYAVADAAIRLHAELAATLWPGRNLRAALAARPWH